MNYEYMVRFDNGKFYKSNRDYASSDWSYCEDEIDATLLLEGDLRYLISEQCLGRACVVMIILGDLMLAEVRMDDIIRIMFEEVAQ